MMKTRRQLCFVKSNYHFSEDDYKLLLICLRAKANGLYWLWIFIKSTSRGNKRSRFRCGWACTYSEVGDDYKSPLGKRHSRNAGHRYLQMVFLALCDQYMLRKNEKYIKEGQRVFVEMKSIILCTQCTLTLKKRIIQRYVYLLYGVEGWTLT